MKSVSLPLVAKAGGSAVAASGIIAGGVLLYKHFEFPKGLDKELINEEEATLAFSDGEGFSTVSDQTSKVTATVKASSSKTDSKFTENKWTCTIKGIAKENENPVTLTISDNSGNFDKSQKEKFVSKFSTHKYGLVKSCARNRPSIPTAEENWTSEIVVELKPTGEESSRKYEFSDEDVDSIFAGTWINPETK